HVVETSVTGGILARGARRGESADGGVLKALRIVAELEPASSQQFLGLRSGQTRPEHRFAGHLVQRLELVEAAQVETDDRGELLPNRVEPADHAGATAER